MMLMQSTGALSLLLLVVLAARGTPTRELHRNPSRIETSFKNQYTGIDPKPEPENESPYVLGNKYLPMHRGQLADRQMAQAVKHHRHHYMY